MTEKYISSAWLLETIEDYKNISCWNTDVLDAETITRVLEVVENKVKGAPSIGPRKLGNKLLAAKNIALEVHLKMVKDHIEDAEGRYQEIGDCLFAQVVRIRDKKAHGKSLDKQDREFYRKNRDIIDLKTTYTESEKDVLAAWGISK